VNDFEKVLSELERMNSMDSFSICLTQHKNKRAELVLNEAIQKCKEFRKTL
jgi:hypothetical protein